MSIRTPFEHISGGRWGHFADWVRKTLPFEKIGDLSFATLSMVEMISETIVENFQRQPPREEILKRCATMLKSVVIINIAAGYHLRVSYHSPSPTEIRNFPFLRYIDLIHAMHKLSLVAMVRSQEGSDVYNRRIDEILIEVLHDILKWIQNRSGKTLSELADHCYKIYDEAGYNYDRSIGMDMESMPVQYI